MTLFFSALALIFLGGLLALATSRYFLLMKALSVTTIMAGCTLGGYDALIRLIQHAPSTTFAFTWIQVFTIRLTIDPLAAFFLIPLFGVAAIAALYSFQYLRDSSRGLASAYNYFFYSLLILSMAMVLCAGDLISFALAWELMSLSSFLLVLYDAHKKSTRDAGYLYLLFAQGGALLLFTAFGLIYSSSNGISLETLAGIPESTKLLIFILLLIGFGSKAGVMPFHIWLPHAHPAAPSHVSALMSGVMIKMGIYGIVRFYLLLAPSSPLFGEIVITLGISSGILGAVYAIANQDIKKMLAYSSVENIGIILLGIGIGMLGAASGNATMAAFGFAGGLLHVANHSLFKSLLFMGAGAVIQQTGCSSCNELGGLMKRMPRTGRSLLIGALSISGLPPFNGFISEFLIYYGAIHGLSLDGGAFIFSALAVASLAVIGALAAAAFTKFIGLIFLGEPRTTMAATASESGILMNSALWILAAACLTIGIWPRPFVQAAFQAGQDATLLFGLSPVPFQALMSNISHCAALFLLICLMVSTLRRLLYRGKEIRTAPTWSCGFSQASGRIQYSGSSYSASITEFFGPFIRTQKRSSTTTSLFPGQTHYSIHIQDIFEVALQRFLVRPLLLVLGRLRWIQHGNIQLYIGYIVLAIFVMLLFI